MFEGCGALHTREEGQGSAPVDDDNANEEAGGWLSPRYSPTTPDLNDALDYSYEV